MSAKHPRLLPLAVMPLALLAGAIASALAPQAAQADRISEDVLEEVMVEGRRQVLVGEARSASEGVVGQDELRIRPLLRPGDVLEAVPGLIVTQHSGSGKSNQMFLRGFNLDHGTDFSTSIDGMPINLPSHGHGQDGHRQLLVADSVAAGNGSLLYAAQGLSLIHI